MAKGDSVPYEIREEVCVKAREYYSDHKDIREINAHFKTDKFPHKGELDVWFDESSHPKHALFIYEYNELSERVLRIPNDWKD